MPAEAQVVVEIMPRRRRSVFANYAATADVPAAARGTVERGMVESTAEVALSRCFVHQWLARAFDYPGAESWAWLCAAEVRSGLLSAIAAIEPDSRAPLRSQLATLLAELRPDGLEAFHNDYIAVIGHAARGSCPVNEIEYGELKADPLFQPHRLADLAAFYRAFGVELGSQADERHDHLSVELEFMAVLAAKEASALGSGVAADALGVGRDAQSRFLHEHLGRWTPAFARRLAGVLDRGVLRSLALFTLAFVESECGRFGVRPGSTDLQLRPADEGAGLCDGCGVSQAFPGAAASQSCG